MKKSVGATLIFCMLTKLSITDAQVPDPGHHPKFLAVYGSVAAGTPINEFHFLASANPLGNTPGQWFHHILRITPNLEKMTFQVSKCTHMIHDTDSNRNDVQKYRLTPIVFNTGPTANFAHTFVGNPLRLIRQLLYLIEVGSVTPQNTPLEVIDYQLWESYNVPLDIVRTKPYLPSLPEICPSGNEQSFSFDFNASLLQLVTENIPLITHMSPLPQSWGYGIKPGQRLPGQVQLTNEATTRIAAEQAVSWALFSFVIYGGGGTLGTTKALTYIYSMAQRAAGSYYAAAAYAYLTRYLSQGQGIQSTLKNTLAAIGHYLGR